jgi:pimeloyl-ACP methyl ester carboxylesterase
MTARPLVADEYGRGPTVILLHGQPGSASDWQGVVPLLCGDFAVVVPDRLGYGRTGGVAADFEGNALSVARLLDRLGIDRAVVVGHSWGGGVALAFAESFPDRTAGLLLVASVGPGERVRWEDRLLAAPLVGELMAAFTFGTAGFVLGTPAVQTHAANRLRPRGRRALDVLSGWTGAGTETPVWRSFLIEQRALVDELGRLGPGLSTVSAPTSVINGSADRAVPPAVGARLAAAIPGATHTVVPGAHHMLLRRHPGAVAAAVRQVAARGGRPNRPTGSTDPPEQALHHEETTDGEG